MLVDAVCIRKAKRGRSRSRSKTSSPTSSAIAAMPQRTSMSLWRHITTKTTSADLPRMTGRRCRSTKYGCPLSKIWRMPMEKQCAGHKRRRPRARRLDRRGNARCSDTIGAAVLAAAKRSRWIAAASWSRQTLLSRDGVNSRTDLRSGSFHARTQRRTPSTPKNVVSECISWAHRGTPIYSRK